MRKLFVALCLAPLLVPAQPAPNELELMWQREGALKFDNMYPRRSYYGKLAIPQSFSADDQYCAYLWNNYDTRGNDLWIVNTKTGEAKALTSIQMMAEFDRDAKLAIDLNKKDDERLAKWATLTDAEWRIEKQKFREEREKKKKPDPAYAGISQAVFAHSHDELLFVFKGDLFRWNLKDKLPHRLFKTRESEFNVAYLPDDSGFIFRRGNGVFRMKFGGVEAIQINPELPDGFLMDGYVISPNGQQMLVTASKPGAPDRQVDWISYRDRFAQAKTTDRSVAEDRFNGEEAVYLFDITDAALNRVDIELKPTEVFRWPGGEDYELISISSEPWSPDGSTFVFASWKRDQKVWRIHEADLSRKKVRTVWEGTSNGEHMTPSFTKPFYTKDGKSIVALLDTTGWRQVHVLERVRGKDRILTDGPFETYPLRMSEDGKAVLVRTSKDSLARRGLYRVELADGKWTKLSANEGTYTEPLISDHSDKMATVFSSWTQMRELVLVDNGHEKVVTHSHKSEQYQKNWVLKPELFTFKNRNGQEISGFMFVPPAVREPGSKHPLFIYVYGGPLGDDNSVWDGNFGSSEFMFNQYLAANCGYITCTIDPRGSSGYSAEFGRANFEHPGTAQTEDLVDCVNYMKSKFNVDPQRVGLTGWSFGGFQTQHALYNAPDVFTLGIAGAGPTEWQNYNTWYTGGVIGNSPNGDGNYLDKFSLTNQASKLKGRLLLLHGIEDTNVLFQDTVKVYRRLLQAGKGPLVELALDPTGDHGMGGDMDTRDRHMIYLSFLLRHWGMGPTN